jgi:hypothetical protein
MFVAFGITPWNDIHFFDWRSILTNLGIIAVAWYFLKKLRKFVVKHGKMIVDGTFWVLTRIVTRSISARLSMRRYCQIQLADESGRTLQVPGQRSTPLDVDEVYVPLMLELGGLDEAYTSSDALNAGNRLIVVGDPGSGKSTFIKRIYRDTCFKTSANPRRGKLPVRLELRNLSPTKKFASDEEAGQWLFDELRSMVTQVEGFEMGQLFDTWVADTGLLVLLDGLDEASSQSYKEIASALRGLGRKLAAMSQNTIVVVTMRIQFYHQVGLQFQEDYPKTLYVRPFSPNEIYLFLTRWPFGDEKKSAINRIYAELSDRPTLRDMCQNPLILAMYVVNSLELASGELPNTRTEFYDKVVRELLVTRRARQNVTSRASTALREQRETFLGLLAYENLSDREQTVNSLSWSRALEYGAQLWKCGPEEAEKKIQELANETGIISQERPGESFRFIHQTFCEFLAAIECARRREHGWQDLMTTQLSMAMSGEAQLLTRLLEVIPFTLALLPAYSRSSALSDVIALPDRLIVGRCFLETQLYGTPEWTTYVETEKTYLSGDSAEDWDERKIRRLQLFSVVVKDSRDWAREISVMHGTIVGLDDLFSVIVEGNRRHIGTIFGTYARQDAAAALRLADDMNIDMLAEFSDVVIEACQEESFLALMLDRVSGDLTTDSSLILLEAGLRYANVAHRLDSTPTTSYLFSLRQQKKMRTANLMLRLCYVDKRSWYDELVRRASSAVNLENRPFPSVKSFLDCIDRFREALWIYLIALVVPVVALLGAWYIADLVPGKNGLALVDWVFGILFGSLIISAFGFSNGILLYTRAIYRDIGNSFPQTYLHAVLPFASLARGTVRKMLASEIVELTRMETLRPNGKSVVLASILRQRYEDVLRNSVVASGVLRCWFAGQRCWGAR